MLDKGVTYNKVKITRNKNQNDIKKYLLELDLDYNYIKFEDIYDIVHEDYNQVIHVGVIKLSNMNYNGYRKQTDKNNLITFKDEEYEHNIQLEDSKKELLYNFSDSKYAVFIIGNENIFNCEKIRKEDILHKKIDNIYIVLIYDDATYAFTEEQERSMYLICESFPVSDEEKQHDIPFNILRKIDKDTILEIRELAFKNPKGIIEIAVKRREVIKYL